MLCFICFYKKAVCLALYEKCKNHILNQLSLTPAITLAAYVCFHKTDLIQFPLSSIKKRNLEGTPIHLF